MNANEIIELLGGTSKVAEICEVTSGAVSQWKSANKIPNARLLYLKLLRPEIFKMHTLISS